jgi:hypothetical protein
MEIHGRSVLVGMGLMILMSWAQPQVSSYFKEVPRNKAGIVETLQSSGRLHPGSWPLKMNELRPAVEVIKAVQQPISTAAYIPRGCLKRDLNGAVSSCDGSLSFAQLKLPKDLRSLGGTASNYVSHNYFTLDDDHSLKCKVVKN